MGKKLSISRIEFILDEMRMSKPAYLVDMFFHLNKLNTHLQHGRWKDLFQGIQKWIFPGVDTNIFPGETKRAKFHLPTRN